MSTPMGSVTDSNVPGGADRELTYGEKAVGITFNPGGHEKVNQVKKLYAEIIDLLRDQQVGPNVQAMTEGKHQKLDIAIMEAQTAQMWAVKGITYIF